MTAAEIDRDNIAYTVFTDRHALKMSVVNQPWEKFCAQLENLKPSHKDSSNLAKFALFSGEKTPATDTAKGGCLRADDFVTCITGIEGDYDAEVMHPEDARTLLENHNIRAVVVTTHTHAPGKPRWRVFCPFSKAYTPEDRLRFVARLNGVLGGVLSTESFTLSQSYYVGRPQHGGEYKVLKTNPIIDRCLDEADDLDDIAMGKQASGKKGSGSNTDAGDGKRNRRELLEQLLQGEDVHGNALRLVGKWLARGMTDDEIRLMMESVADAVAEQRGAERAACLLGSELQRMIDGGRAKGYEPSDDAAFSAWPTLADPFTEYPVPSFPVGILPQAMQDYCNERSAQSGFDVGGYAFTLLMAAGNTADHRARLQLGPFSVPAFQWGGLVGESGSGKSPVINAAGQFAETINTELVNESGRLLAEWYAAAEDARKAKEEIPPKPLWKQRHATDTTTEALGLLLIDNPEGVNMYHHEITEFLGRMDAYTGKDGGKDRGVYLRSYDGGMVTINRASKPIPLVIPDFSVGIVAGIQPEVLAAKFKAAGAGADGLYQRFGLYCLQEAGEVSYTHRMGEFTEVNVQAIFRQLHDWTFHKPFRVNLAPDAQQAMQDYHNHVRTLAQRTSAKRFAEHLDKFPGMLGRFAFALHLTHAAATGGDPLRMVSLDTLQAAKRLMGCLYRHSEAVYRVLDREAGKVRDLVRSAAEAILTKQWDTVKRGDLTRNATHWQGADNRDAESAIDYLIELGWLQDITPPSLPGKRGRRSAGLFLVNPDVHIRFEAQAQRIREERAERYRALQGIQEAIS